MAACICPGIDGYRVKRRSCPAHGEDAMPASWNQPPASPPELVTGAADRAAGFTRVRINKEGSQ